jgi:hypothetical protein
MLLEPDPFPTLVQTGSGSEILSASRDYKHFKSAKIILIKVLSYK